MKKIFFILLFICVQAFASITYDKYYSKANITLDFSDLISSLGPVEYTTGNVSVSEYLNEYQIEASYDVSDAESFSISLETNSIDSNLANGNYYRYELDTLTEATREESETITYVFIMDDGLTITNYAGTTSSSGSSIDNGNTVNEYELSTNVSITGISVKHTVQLGTSDSKCKETYEFSDSGSVITFGSCPVSITTSSGSSSNLYEGDLNGEVLTFSNDDAENTNIYVESDLYNTSGTLIGTFRLGPVYGLKLYDTDGNEF